MSYAQARDVSGSTALNFDATTTGVLSWNTHAREGRIAFRLLRDRVPTTPFLDLMTWSESERRSFSPQYDDVRVDTDVIRAYAPFNGIELAADVEFAQLAFSAPYARLDDSVSAYGGGSARILDVAARSQFIVEGERGWCSPTSLAMLHAYHGTDLTTEDTAAAVYDTAYGGTGNWSFNTAYSGALGFRASVAHLRDLEHARQLIEFGLPLAISYSWHGDDLPGAPVEHSDGHFVVLTGFAENGDCAVNDPAHPQLKVVYPRAAIERIWLRAGGVAYAIAPVGIEYAHLL
jgi:hypothetical protein